MIVSPGLERAGWAPGIGSPPPRFPGKLRRRIIPPDPKVRSIMAEQHHPSHEPQGTDHQEEEQQQLAREAPETHEPRPSQATAEPQPHPAAAAEPQPAPAAPEPPPPDVAAG